MAEHGREGASSGACAGEHVLSTGSHVAIKVEAGWARRADASSCGGSVGCGDEYSVGHGQPAGRVEHSSLGFVAYRLSSINQRYQACRAIGDLHSAMLDRGLTATKTVALIGTRARGCENPDPAEQVLLVRYEAYVDVGLEFATQRSAPSTARPSHSRLEQQYGRLIHLFRGELAPVRHALRVRTCRVVRREIEGKRVGSISGARHHHVTGRQRYGCPVSSYLAAACDSGGLRLRRGRSVRDCCSRSWGPLQSTRSVELFRT